MPSSATDTPTRAASAARPQTRAWKQLIDDSKAPSATASNQRALLRAHLAAAERLANRRKALPPTTAPEESDPTTPVAPIAPAEQPQEEEKKEEEETPEWLLQTEAFNRFAATPTEAAAPEIAAVLPQQLKELRSKVVLAAADAAVAAAPFLTMEDVMAIFSATIVGVTVTKKVMAEASRRAAKAVLHGRAEDEVWTHVVAQLSNEHVTSRCLVVAVATQLTDEVDKASQPMVLKVVSDVLQVTAVDKTVQVRDAARDLIKHFCTRFGNEPADAALQTLPPQVRTRFTATASKTVNASGRKVPAKKPQSNMRDLIKARRAALKKEGSGTSDPAVESQIPKDSTSEKSPDENSTPVEPTA